VSHSRVQVIWMLLTSAGLIVPKWLHMQDPNISSDAMTLLLLKLLRWTVRPFYPRDLYWANPSSAECDWPSTSVGLSPLCLMEANQTTDNNVNELARH